MAFQTIVTNTRTFVSTGPGTYQKSDIAFGAPSVTLKLAPGKVSQKDGPVGASVTRSTERDVTVNGVTSRKRGSVSLQMQIPATGFTTADITTMIADIQGFTTEENLRRLLLGEY